MIKVVNVVYFFAKVAIVIAMAVLVFTDTTIAVYMDKSWFDSLWNSFTWMFNWKVLLGLLVLLGLYLPDAIKSWRSLINKQVQQ